VVIFFVYEAKFTYAYAAELVSVYFCCICIVQCVFCLLIIWLMSPAKDSVAGIIALPSSVADRTANIEKTCEFLKEKGVVLPSDIVKGESVI